MTIYGCWYANIFEKFEFVTWINNANMLHPMKLLQISYTITWRGKRPFSLFHLTLVFEPKVSFSKNKRTKSFRILVFEICFVGSVKWFYSLNIDRYQTVHCESIFTENKYTKGTSDTLQLIYIKVSIYNVLYSNIKVEFGLF